MFNLGKFATLGRNEDDTLAHVATGEMVVRPEVLGPELTNQIKNTMKGFGLDPARYTVGSGANSLNPVTGQPEFFLSGLFGSSGTGKYIKRLEEEYKPQIENLQFATPGFQDPFGTYDISREGVQLTPSEQVAGTSQMFQNILPGLANRAQNNLFGQQLMGAYEAPTMSRQELQDMFSASIQPQEQMIDMQTDSALSRILGGRGISTGSASAMGAAQRQADLAKQQLRLGAYGGAQKSYLDDMTSLQNLLGTAQGFETQALGNLAGAAQAQFAPYAQMGRFLPNILGYGQNLTNFDMGKIGAAIDLQNQYAQYRAQPKAGFLQNVVLPTLSAVSGGNMSMPSFGGTTATASTPAGTQAANAMYGGGGTSASSLYQPTSMQPSNTAYTSGMFFQ